MTTDNDSQNLHVIFGAGPVGMAVMEALVSRGQRVRLVNRSGRANAPEGVELAAGDATDPATTRDLCRGAAVVYNCTNPPYTKWPDLFPPLQAGVLAGAASAGARLVVMENVYMYGPTGGRPLTEDLPYAATTRKGRVRAKMAEELLAAHQAGRVQIAIGRASDYFGPRGLLAAMGERVFYPALAGKAAQAMGNLDLPHTQSYLPDIGQGLAILGEREEALGQAWHLPSPETVTTRQFIELVFEETGQPPKVQVLPKFMLKILSLFSPMMRELDEMLYEFEEPFILDHSKFEQAFGNHATPLHEAIRTTIAWYRQNPK
jgi:nucleoside-diphosphate-sugar epimerase